MSITHVIDRYRSAGLRYNPFCSSVDLDDALFIDRGLSPPDLAAGPQLIQVIGQKGAGKSSQLARWRRDQPGPYHYVEPARTGRRAKPPVRALVYADEVDRMFRGPRQHWFRDIAARDGTIVAGTHRDLAGGAQRAGLSVTTHELGSVEAETLRRIVDRRIMAATIPGTSPRIAVDDDEIDRIVLLAQGSIRRALNELHVLITARVDGCDDQPPSVRRR